MKYRKLFLSVTGVIDMDKLVHIGARIRLFRKHQNLTLEELAYMVHKSPSTLCKYENGSVNIDILTLSEIADALGVELSQLTDFRSGKVRHAERNNSNFFRRHKRFYVYHLYSHQKDLLLGVMDVTSGSADTNEDKIVLYLNFGKEISIDNPMFIYTGSMTCDDSFAYIDLENTSGMKDHLYILAKSPHWLRNQVKGLALSVSSVYGCPSGIVMMFSAEQLEINDDLYKELRIDSDVILDFAEKTNLIAPI